MTRRIRLFAAGAAVAAIALGLAVTAAPQEGHAHHSAYADQEASGIAGLTAREMAQLLAGEGMGLARPAELNGYPGPLHVLEAADELALSPEQRRRTQEIFDAMHEAAVRLGGEIVERERTLSRRFEHGHIDDAALARLTAEIGALQGELRQVHLRAHLRMKELLSDEQVAAYDALRGYAKEKNPA